MPRMLTALAVIAALSAPATWAADGPPAGVYSCYDSRMGINVPGCIRTSMGCTGMVITPMPVVMFGLIDGTTYSDCGHHGHYLNTMPLPGSLTMTDGSRQGWRYRKSADWAFRLIDNSTGKDLYTCPLEVKKNPNPRTMVIARRRVSARDDVIDIRPRRQSSLSAVSAWAEAWRSRSKLISSFIAFLLRAPPRGQM